MSENTTITVYSKPGCVQCQATMRKLDKRGAAYEVRDVIAHIADDGEFLEVMEQRLGEQAQVRRVSR